MSNYIHLLDFWYYIDDNWNHLCSIFQGYSIDFYKLNQEMDFFINNIQ